MMATETADKQARVDQLKDAILKGEAEAEGMDATNPERQRMMTAWCQSTDEARNDAKSNVMCAKAKAKGDFLMRREQLLHYWCVSQGKAGSPKCKQMEFGKLMSETDSGEERKRQAAQFNAARTAAETQQALEEETKVMMQSACDSSLGKSELFATACAKMRTEL